MLYLCNVELQAQNILEEFLVTCTVKLNFIFCQHCNTWGAKDLYYIYNCILLVMGIKFDEELQSVIEGDVVTVSVVADHISEVNVTIFVQVTPITASGKI